MTLSLLFALVAAVIAIALLMRLRQLQAEHRRAAAALNQRCRKVAHDLRNPLSSIMAFASLIEADPGSDRVASWASKIGMGADQLESSIDAVQNLSGGDQGPRLTN